jgi:hypothetical protein
MDLHPKQSLEILNQPGVIHQTPARFPGDQQIEVAILIGFAAGYRAKHTQAVGAAPPGKPENLLPQFRAQGVEREHISIVRQKLSRFFGTPERSDAPHFRRKTGRRFCSSQLIIYQAFIEGAIDLPKHLAARVHNLYFNPEHEEFAPIPRRLRDYLPFSEAILKPPLEWFFLFRVLPDLLHEIRVALDLEIEPPRVVHACLPQVAAFIVLLGVEGRMMQVLE